MRREHFIYLALFLATATVFWPVTHCQFINYDDCTYVTENTHVRQGLTPATAVWAFRAVDCCNWHPVTWLSHMLDFQLFGLNAGAHHLVNLLFHCANTLLLFHVLRRMTRELWPSAVVSALFALHPLHVESVAWVAERKDVLSTCFGLLTIWAYWRYVQCGIPKAKFRSRFYLLAIFFFALGLMSKPMLVTWPFVLLLLDFWPLGRISGFDFHVPASSVLYVPPRPLSGLLLEKLPFFVLSIVSSAITFLVQRHGGAMVEMSQLTLSGRIGNALFSYVRYLGKAFWPRDLAIVYPHPGIWPAWQIIASAALLVSITGVVAWQTKRRHFLLFGWLWFLGTLVPVIGLVQVGSESIADRYTYVPLIGLFIMVVWSAKDVVARWRLSRAGAGLAVTAVLIGCLVVTRRQLNHWQDGEAVFRHSLDVTSDNVLARCNLADALLREGKIDQGLDQYRELLRNYPRSAVARVELASALENQGKIRESIESYREALLRKPDMPGVLNNLAWILATNEDPAIRNGLEAVRLAESACASTHYQVTMYIGTLAAAYAEAGRYDDAIRTAEKARASAIASGEDALAEKNLQLMQLYQSGRPCRELSGRN